VATQYALSLDRACPNGAVGTFRMPRRRSACTQAIGLLVAASALWGDGLPRIPAPPGFFLFGLRVPRPGAGDEDTAASAMTANAGAMTGAMAAYPSPPVDPAVGTGRYVRLVWPRALKDPTHASRRPCRVVLGGLGTLASLGGADTVKESILPGRIVTARAGGVIQSLSMTGPSHRQSAPRLSMTRDDAGMLFRPGAISVRDKP